MIYLIRLAETKELLGVFWAETLSNLHAVIEERCTSPDWCEFKRIKEGSAEILNLDEMTAEFGHDVVVEAEDDKGWKPYRASSRSGY